MTESKTSQADASLSLYRFRWIGYGLVIFAFVDTLYLLIPPKFLDPFWEFQTIGGLVERVVVPLLGLTLIFYGESFQRSAIEKLLVRFLSWLTIVLMVIFLLLLPLCVLNTNRINTRNAGQIKEQLDLRINQLNQIQQQVTQSKPEDLENLGKQLQQAGVQIDPSKPEELIKQVKDRAGLLQKQLEDQAKLERNSRFNALLKNSIKFNIGAIIASTMFFMLWKTTRWAR